MIKKVILLYVITVTGCCNITASSAVQDSTSLQLQLQEAIECFDSKQVELLLKLGAQVNANLENAVTPLELVIQLGSQEKNQIEHRAVLTHMLQLLLVHGANPNQQMHCRSNIPAIAYLGCCRTNTLYLAQILAQDSRFDPFSKADYFDERLNSRGGWTSLNIVLYSEGEPIVPVPQGEKWEIVELLQNIEKKRKSSLCCWSFFNRKK